MMVLRPPLSPQPPAIRQNNKYYADVKDELKPPELSRRKSSQWNNMFHTTALPSLYALRRSLIPKISCKEFGVTKQFCISIQQKICQRLTYSNYNSPRKVLKA